MPSALHRRLTAALIASALGCESPQDPDPVPGDPGWRESQVIAVQEAVHRQQFQEHAPGAPAGSVTFCLARTTETDQLPWTDPPDALWQRFAGHVPVVKKVSLCRVDLRGDTDATTGGPAIVFRIAPLHWENDAEIVLEGGYHRGGLAASGQTYRVRYQNGRWVVVEARWRWIA